MNFPVVTLDQLRPILVGFRKSRGLTQAALAARLGIAQQTYAQLEANPASASVERLFRLLRVLGVELVLTDAAADQTASQVVSDASMTRYSVSSGTSTGMTVQEPETAVQGKPLSSSQPNAPKPVTPRKREVW